MQNFGRIFQYMGFFSKYDGFILCLFSSVQTTGNYMYSRYVGKVLLFSRVFFKTVVLREGMPSPLGKILWRLCSFPVYLSFIRRKKLTTSFLSLR